MKQLFKHNLCFDLAFEYVKHVQDDANALSCEILKSVNFSDGCFFTLLPADANLERIYEFQSGMILPQNPEQTYFIAGEKSTYSAIPNIKDELCKLILEEIKSHD